MAFSPTRLNGHAGFTHATRLELPNLEIPFAMMCGAIGNKPDRYSLFDIVKIEKKARPGLSRYRPSLGEFLQRKESTMPKSAPATNRRTARYEKLCAMIERRQRKLDRDQRSVERGVKALAKMEQQRRRLRKEIEKRERQAADAIVETVTPPSSIETDHLPEPAFEIMVEADVPLADLGETEIGRANATSWNAIPAVAKAKRQRKPKAPTVAQSVAPEIDTLHRPEQREARMEAAGFRKVSRKR